LYSLRAGSAESQASEIAIVSTTIPRSPARTGARALSATHFVAAPRPPT
jgi:hypothetical protein